MPDLDIIDIHTHTFASADRGISYQRGASGGTREPTRNGTIEELRGLMGEAGISHSVMLMYTPTRYMYEARVQRHEMPSDPADRENVEREVKTMMAQRMIENNEWAIGVSAEHPELVTFAGLDPVYMDEQTVVGEIEDKVKRGARGVKIVPRALAIYADDERLWPVYERISELGVPIVSQAGAGGEQGDRGAFGRPKYFEKALAEFPNLVVNVAHLGGGHEDDVLELCHRFPNFYTDISSRLGELDDPDSEMTPEWLVAFIRDCGPEHVLFGTNYPGPDPVQYARLLRELPLTDAEKELVANGNAKRLIEH
jgi:predicted TIM-barrel fold metal-dependent hydrolase